MVFYLPLTFKSQDSTSIHDLFYKKQQQSLSLLSGWSVGNLVYSPLATNNLFSPESTNEYFHQMNFSWNLLNVGIAGLGHIIVNKDSKKPWDMKTLYDKKKKAESELKALEAYKTQKLIKTHTLLSPYFTSSNAQKLLSSASFKAT